MAPLQLVRRALVEKPTRPASLILEAWAQGYMVGSLIIMAAITIANMKKGVLLHRLILLELILGTFHGTFIFTNPPVYGWYLGATATLLNISWSLHNVIAWIKTKPFLSRRWSLFYIGTVALAQPYWVVEIYANFAYFNNENKLFAKTRPYEALFRDPWWLFTTALLFHKIRTHYRIPLTTLLRISPRFAILLTAMLLSIAFIILDLISVTSDAFNDALPDGLNPFWKLAFVFKCLTDSIVLDDFKTALDRLMQYRLRVEGCSEDDGVYGRGESNATAGTGEDQAKGVMMRSFPRSQGAPELATPCVKEPPDPLEYEVSSSSTDGADESGPGRWSASYARSHPLLAAQRQQGRSSTKSDIEWIEKELAVHSSCSSPMSPGGGFAAGLGRVEELGSGEGGTELLEVGAGKRPVARVVTKPVDHWDEMPDLAVLRDPSYVDDGGRYAQGAVPHPHAPAPTSTVRRPPTADEDNDDGADIDASVGQQERPKGDSDETRDLG